MPDPSFALRAGASGPGVTGTPGNVLTFGEDGRSVSGMPVSAGTEIRSADADIIFDHTNGIKRFIVLITDLPENARVWASLAGPCVPDATQLVAVGGCYWSDFEEVTLIANYSGAASSVTVPIRIFWIPAAE